ncbi:MAG TPA: cytochrome c [Mucilaginibacter sp.]
MKLRFALMVLIACFAFNANAQTKYKKSSGAGSMTRGLVVYKSVCLACHMATGTGVPHLNPPLINTSYVNGPKPALIKIVLNGFDEDVEINGQKYSNTMTPHSDLTDQQIADVLTYVRKSFGNKGSSVSAAEVKKVRETK